MLESLYIKNFALIEDVSIHFSENLNVLTGETGAGKSIVIDAVTILLGTRAQAEFIRSGTEKALIEGVFFIEDGHYAFQLLNELGIDIDEGQHLILTREILMNGRNSCRVNGRTVALNQFRRIGCSIVDIHGQHDHQVLLAAENHLAILDRFNGAEHLQLLNEVKEGYVSWNSLKTELFRIKANEKESLQRIDLLRYQLNEIREADPKEDDLEQLIREATLLANAEKVCSGINTAYFHLFSSENNKTAYDSLSSGISALQDISKYDFSIEKTIEQLEPCLYTIEEAAHSIRDYIEGIEYSPQRLEEVERRVQLLKDLCKKYGPTIREVLIFAEQAKIELQELENYTETTELLEQKIEDRWQYFQVKAAKLTEQRKKIASLLEEKVIFELRELAMPDVQFSVSFEECEPLAIGQERVQFLISPNLGEPLLPLAKIASGGELSRIMLALKSISAHLDGIGTLIFDEIDSGIGGKTAQKVAEKLERISKMQQVICVTHSPLIAALADYHLLLEKTSQEGRTKTLIRLLNDEERVEELTRMLGGETQTAELKNHVMQILKK